MFSDSDCFSRPARSAVADPSSTIAPYTTGLSGVHIETDSLLRSILFWTMGVPMLALLAVRIQKLTQCHLRHLMAMHANKNQQVYFSRNRSEWWPWIKYHIVYAPLLSKRRSRELRVSPAVSLGTLPTRFQAIILGLYVLSNLAYCMILDYGSDNKYEILAELRGRSGTLAVANMVPLVLLAGRNNPLIALLQVSFDTYNLLHRWMGRIVVIQSIIHVAAWTVAEVASGHWISVWEGMSTPFMIWGGAGTVAVLLMAVLSPGPLRHAFYETFLHLHILLAMVAMAGIYLHCSIEELAPLTYIRGAVFLWVLERLLRLGRVLWCNFFRGSWTKVQLTALPGGACRATLQLPSRVDIKPGTHAYLRFAGLKIWESHPFSIAWEDDDARTDMKSSEKSDRETSASTTVSFIIQAKGGLTRQLLNLANSSQPNNTTSPAYAIFEGPYAGHHSLDSYGHVVLFAGSSGITPQLLYVRHLIRGCQDATVATRRITLIWVVKHHSHIDWAEPWLSSLIHSSGHEGIFNPRIFITNPRSDAESIAFSHGAVISFGRPNAAQIVTSEVGEQIGAMCVTVCGPGALSDDVRSAVRDVQDLSCVDFIEESFTW